MTEFMSHCAISEQERQSTVLLESGLQKDSLLLERGIGGSEVAGIFFAQPFQKGRSKKMHPRKT